MPRRNRTAFVAPPCHGEHRGAHIRRTGALLIGLHHARVRRPQRDCEPQLDLAGENDACTSSRRARQRGVAPTVVALARASTRASPGTRTPAGVALGRRLYRDTRGSAPRPARLHLCMRRARARATAPRGPCRGVSAQTPCSPSCVRPRHSVPLGTVASSIRACDSVHIADSRRSAR